MASQPRTQKLKAILLEWAQEEFGELHEDGIEVDYLDWPLTRLAEGWTIQKLAKEIAAKTGEPASRQWISQLVNTDKVRLAAARREAAGVLAEQAVDISDVVGGNAQASAAHVQAARLQIETRKWLAGVLDAHTFAPSQRHEVSIDLGQLHLDALRQRRAEELALANASPPMRHLGAGAGEEIAEVIEVSG
jgi:hypothetical protein